MRRRRKGMRKRRGKKNGYCTRGTEEGYKTLKEERRRRMKNTEETER